MKIHSYSVNPEHPHATAVDRVEIEYLDPCYPQSYVITNTSFPSAVINPGSGKNRIRIQANKIFFDKIQTMVQVKTVANNLVVSLATPFRGSGICESGCDENQNVTMRLLQSASIAEHAECSSIADPEIRMACNYDISVTGDKVHSST